MISEESSDLNGFGNEMRRAAMTGDSVGGLVVVDILTMSRSRCANKGANRELFAASIDRKENVCTAISRVLSFNQRARTTTERYVLPPPNNQMTW